MLHCFERRRRRRVEGNGEISINVKQLDHTSHSRNLNFSPATSADSERLSLLLLLALLHIVIQASCCYNFKTPTYAKLQFNRKRQLFCESLLTLMGIFVMIVRRDTSKII